MLLLLGQHLALLLQGVLDPLLLLPALHL